MATYAQGAAIARSVFRYRQHSGGRAHFFSRCSCTTSSVSAKARRRSSVATCTCTNAFTTPAISSGSLATERHS
jgi:hypothetical protein